MGAAMGPVEIMKSIERGNRLLGVHINSIKGKDQMTKVCGPSPFDSLGIQISNDGSERYADRMGKWQMDILRRPRSI